ncbi:MAG: hypothetical protein Q7V01_06570 [Vicinamibacterales bacterium]|nr:hypothetical protein [Vicinamibacterales bacterium]
MASTARTRFITLATLGYGLFAALWIFVTDRLIAVLEALDERQGAVS